MFFTKSVTTPPIGFNRNGRHIPLKLYGTPPNLNTYFKLLKESGAEYVALFGGAIRDADYASRYNKKCSIKDYDFRIWFDEDSYELQLNSFIDELERVAHSKVRQVPSAGTGKIRYCIDYDGVEFDISIRPVPDVFKNKVISSSIVAQERCSDGDIGICSVAIDSSGQAWAMPEYLSDQENKTLTIYPNANRRRKEEYTQRMLVKFPDHRLLDLETCADVSEYRPVNS